MRPKVNTTAMRSQGYCYEALYCSYKSYTTATNHVHQAGMACEAGGYLGEACSSTSHVHQGAGSVVKPAAVLTLFYKTLPTPPPFKV